MRAAVQKELHDAERGIRLMDTESRMPGWWALLIGATLVLWTGAAQAIIEARANPLEPLRVIAVLAVGAGLVLRWLWRPTAAPADGAVPGE